MKEGKDKFCGMTQTLVSVATGARRNIVKNERNDSYWIPKQMYCPNCGTLSVGYQREGLTEFECGRCLTMFVRSYKNRRQDLLLITVSTTNVTIQSNYDLHSANGEAWQSDSTRRTTHHAWLKQC